MRTGTVSLPVVDLTAVPECHDDNEENVVGDRVDDAVITDPHPQAWSTMKSAGSRGRGSCANNAMAPCSR